MHKYIKKGMSHVKILFCYSKININIFSLQIKIVIYRHCPKTSPKTIPKTLILHNFMSTFDTSDYFQNKNPSSGQRLCAF